MNSLTTEQYRVLAANVEFNQLLADDQELIELEKLKYNKKLHSCTMFETLGIGSWSIGKLPIMPLTAAKWAFLWILDNRFTNLQDVTELSELDIDIMLYILSIPSLDDIKCSLHEIPAVAAGYHRIPQLPLQEIVIELNRVIQQAFLPLTMLPSKTECNEESYFDEIWLTAIAGCAAREACMSLYYCMHKMSLSSVFALWVNYRRREGSEAQQIRYPVSEEIEQKISARVDKLARDFLTKV